MRLTIAAFALAVTVFPACSHQRTVTGTQSLKATSAPLLSAAAAPTGIGRRSDCDADAVAVKSAQPEFPDLLIRPGHPLEWVVAVMVKLDAKGHVEHAAVSRSYGETTQNHTIVRRALNAEALIAAYTATYTPKVVHCKAVPSTYVYQITFTGAP